MACVRRKDNVGATDTHLLSESEDIDVLDVQLRRMGAVLTEQAVNGAALSAAPIDGGLNNLRTVRTADERAAPYKRPWRRARIAQPGTRLRQARDHGRPTRGRSCPPTC